MGIKFTNNAVSTLASAITDVATTLTVMAGDGAKFPTLGGGDYFRATIMSAGAMEIVKVTVRTGDIFTITRAEEGTIAAAFSSGAAVSLYITNQDLVDLVNERQAPVTAIGVLKGTGSAVVMAIAGTDYVSPSGTEVVSNKTLTNATIFTAGSAGAVTAASAATPLRVESAGSGNEAYMTFVIPGVYGVGFGMDSSGQFNVGGWSLGGNKYKVWTARDSYAWSFTDASTINSGSYTALSPKVGVAISVPVPAPFTFYNNGLAWGAQWAVPPLGFFGSNLYYSGGWKFIHNYGYAGYLGMDAGGGITLSTTTNQSSVADSAANPINRLYIDAAGVMTVSGDIVTHRGNDTGVVYLGNSKAHYSYFDGAKFQIFGGPVVTASPLGVACSAAPLAPLDVKAGPNVHFLVETDTLGEVQLGTLTDGGTARRYLGLFGNPYVYPTVDNACHFGSSSNRWNTIYCVNGTINTSDERLKTDIQDSTLGLDFVEALRPVSYKWLVGQNIVTRVEDGVEVVPPYTTIDGVEMPESTKPKYKDVVTPVPGVRPHWGMIAQDVHSAMKAKGVADFGGFVMEDPKNPDSTQSLRYHEFIAPMIKAIQELSEKVKVLEAQLAAK